MTQIQEIGPYERLLTVSIDSDQLAAARRAAAARLSKSTKIKGFRPGKAPLRVVESIVGAETLDREAIDEALPKALATAIAETDLRPVVYPSLRDVRYLEDGAEADVVITLWPTPERLPDFRDRRVTVERRTVSDTDVDEQVDRMRDQFAELDEVEREGFDGDFVLVDVATSVSGEEVSEGSTKDFMYEIGAGTLFPGMDDALRGAAAGAIVEFETTLPDGMSDAPDPQAKVRILVKRVLAKRLPDLTDEWVEDVSEFESVAEMRAQLAEEMQRILDRGVRAQFEQQLLADLVADLDVALPDALLQAEMDSVLHRFAHRLEGQGVSLEQYFELTGQDRDDFTADLRSQAEANLRTRVLLEAVAEQEGLEVGDGEYDREVAALAASGGVDEAEYRAAISEGGHEATLTGDILRRKAVDLLVEHAVAVDADGTVVDLPDDGAGGESAAGEPDEIPDDEPLTTEVDQ